MDSRALVPLTTPTTMPLLPLICSSFFRSARGPWPSQRPVVMPTPKMESLCEPPADKISCRFLVELLDAKFAQQEQLLGREIN